MAEPHRECLERSALAEDAMEATQAIDANTGHGRLLVLPLPGRAGLLQSHQVSLRLFLLRLR